MDELNSVKDRRTTVDEIFRQLQEEISTLRMLPGDKISEAEVAARFGVSRQPVRDAFSRLANLDMLLIRPQRATEIKRFSMREITKSRFIRAAVEAEVLRLAAKRIDTRGEERLASSLNDQAEALAKDDMEAFGRLDYLFHQAICDIAETDYAFEVIAKEKAKVDRLCMLGLSKEARMPQLLEDHKRIATAIAARDAQGAVDAGMEHLSRLDETIEAIRSTNAHYFEAL